jgi:FtsH-binding integral membrane protein
MSSIPRPVSSVTDAGMFGALAVFGSTTKRSLAGAGQFFSTGLIGLVVASILGIFWNNDALQSLISVVGVIVFTGLTAWDAQRLKQMAAGLPQGHGAQRVPRSSTTPGSGFAAATGVSACS